MICGRLKALSHDSPDDSVVRPAACASRVSERLAGGSASIHPVEASRDTAKTPESVALTPTDDAVQGASDETERGSITGSEASNHRFELRDINIVFPERQLTVVTGPTASGKTALLVRIGEVLSFKRSCCTHMDVVRWLC